MCLEATPQIVTVSILIQRNGKFVIFNAILMHRLNVLIILRYLIYICRYVAAGGADALVTLWDLGECVCLRSFKELEYVEILLLRNSDNFRLK